MYDMYDTEHFVVLTKKGPMILQNPTTPNKPPLTKKPGGKRNKKAKGAQKGTATSKKSNKPKLGVTRKPAHIRNFTNEELMVKLANAHQIRSPDVTYY